MTSKEEFKKLREEYYNEFLVEDFDDVGIWNSLEKDLKVLEILKKIIVFKTSIFTDYIFISFPKKSKEKEIIKEWLNEK